ncbi:hypothetical protein F4678DRAFT_34676 [Xylaria arbuscula]|nr:hypothetical protein F4678DRAFT_34676 [Xylaria arbuscula]
MLAEAKNRIVLVDGASVYPTSLLVSPYLLVSYESRELAKHFYSCHLTVLAKGYIRKNRLHVETDEGPPVGIVYLSVQHDTFCDGFWWPERIAMKRNHITSRLRGTVHFGVAGTVTERDHGNLDDLFSSVETVCCMKYFWVGWWGGVVLGGFGVLDLGQLKFPKVQHWFAILMPIQGMPLLTSPVEELMMVVGQRGWEGQRQLKNPVTYSYVAARLEDNGTWRLITCEIPLRHLNQLLPPRPG